MHRRTARMAGVAERLTVRVPEAAEMLSIGRSTLYQLIGSGDIATIKAGRTTLVPVESIRNFIIKSGG
ncbi:helix-turn-helix domain-containing protein [Sphingomonadaceae bacterium G21617-S1]|uniref:helix-turn-helix domain-containing protein n=1 Tax=Rhizorhabdus sp. TaxID=1968843 RepID=UPI0022C9AD48|nr:helix-turn-helix domain-containing protein [Sphingomonadaceae bacterium G21617-S1]